MVKTLDQRRRTAAAVSAKRNRIAQRDAVIRAITRARNHARHGRFPFVDLVRELDKHEVGTVQWWNAVNRIKVSLK